MIVSRAELKIADAAEAFAFDFRDKRVLDIGSSTGGFTEFALLAGASSVVAIEKGTKQMKAPLRFDPRVELHEKTSIFDVVTKGRTGGEVMIDEPDVVVADVSFISLRPVLKHVAEKIASSSTDFLVMLKPQFEAREEQLNRGVVKNEKIRREILKDFEVWLKHNNFRVVKKKDNNLVGKKGNIERFYWLSMV